MDPELGQALESMEERLNHRIDHRVESMEERVNHRIDERTERVETTLLNEFRKWAVPIHYRIKAIEQLNERVLLLEERVGELEPRERKQSPKFAG